MEIHRALTERLTALYGKPHNGDRMLHWHVPQGLGLDIHINLDLLTAPQLVTVWVFDPSQTGPDAAKCYRVDGLDDVPRVITEITESVPSSSR
jgi:hypothetical protein